MKKPRKRTMLGKYIVADPEICGGQPTFAGSRVMVWQVLDRLAKGRSWRTIMADWPGSVSKEAIAELMQLAKQAFLDHALDYSRESVPA